MRILLVLLMCCLLMRSGNAMDAAAEACRLFVTSVLPGLFPYMVLSLMLVSRFSARLPSWLLTALGWGGGSPTGARLLHMTDLPRRQRVRLAVTTATMSPMFLLGTVGAWLNSAVAGAVVLASVLAGGLLAGMLAALFVQDAPGAAASSVCQQPMTFGSAIDQASRTMLLVCGTMVMWRVFASLAVGVAPECILLSLVTGMEVTTGASAIAGMPLPLRWRTALIAGATGFGGMAILMQNRAAGESPLPLAAQALWQAVHGGLSFLLALGLMQLIP